MKPTDLQVYDAFPTLINGVVNGARAMHQVPLDQMLTVLDRVEAAGCYNSGVAPRRSPPRRWPGTDRCAHCGQQAPADGPSEWWCTAKCQQAWTAAFGDPLVGYVDAPGVPRTTTAGRPRGDGYRCYEHRDGRERGEPAEHGHLLSLSGRRFVASHREGVPSRSTQTCGGRTPVARIVEAFELGERFVTRVPASRANPFELRGRY